MINQVAQTTRRPALLFVALAGLSLIVLLAPSVAQASQPESTTATSSAVSQDSSSYTIKEAGIQFDVPKGWKADVDKDNHNVVLSVEDGAMTITFVVEDKYADVMKGMKDGLKERLTDMKSEGEPKEDTHNGMTHISESGEGMLKDSGVFWSIDVLKATNNVTILTFGIRKVMDAHTDEYRKWVMSIKKI